MIEAVPVTDHTPLPDPSLKRNIAWWFQGPDGWRVPDINNGAPYMAGSPQWWRFVNWFVFRNPMMNFVGFVAGVEDQNYTVEGIAPVLRTTGRDCEPQQIGWRWATIRLYSGRELPFRSYYGPSWGWVRALGKPVTEFYIGWRPASGGLGLKLVFPKQ